ncbi:hypothetical protein [Anaerospora sp.]|jgi:hypothetical protein|uniref:hypothetical protein n=1 Tax=Anaerospora sp. TaxID=1960278 RepID=UPI00289D81DF|nr:hypothetical protein [Anaerospora sp.]
MYYRMRVFFILIVIGALLVAGGCGTAPQQKPDQPMEQAQEMGEDAWNNMMKNKPDMMKKAMSNPEMRSAMIKMMSEPEMKQPMLDIMADPSMKDVVRSMMKDPRIKPTAQEALKN